MYFETQSTFNPLTKTMETLSEIRQDNPVKPRAKAFIATLINQNLAFGYCLLVVSVVLFWTSEFSVERGEDYWFGLFIVHYALAIIYTVYLISDGKYGIKKSWRKENLSDTIVLLNLYFVSAFALNRVIAIFEDSVGWLCVYVGCASLTLLSFHFYNSLPKWANKLQHLLLGASLLLFIYQALFVSRFYFVGSIGIIVLGVGAHIFVPVTLIVVSTRIIKFYEGKIRYGWLVAGISIPMLFTAAFVKEWNKRSEVIDKLSNQSVLRQDSLLPAWIKIGQWIKVDWITHRLLRSDLVYTTRNRNRREWFFLPGNFSWAEARKHDPLVFISSHFKENYLSAEDRVKIIQAISGGRHNAEERLWEGDNLATSYVVSDVEVFPDLRLAYTEKYLSITNSSEHRWRGNSQEAIYTFQLPEGSVVTSLSLWINGKEEKGILTSKEKAQKAYETIVGHEARDPSMIHWQEGNTVSVRVFPCASDEERKFKIGITTPLVEEEGKLVYKSISFEGPDANHAQETVRLSFTGGSRNIDIPNGFTKDIDGNFVFEGEYDPELQLEFDPEPIRDNNVFIFKGQQYSVEEYEPVNVSFVAKDIYLDINDTWLDREIEFFRRIRNDRNVFIYFDERFVRLTEENWDLIEHFEDNNFSIFPFHRIDNAANALVVTKGKRLSPYLRDMRESPFGTALKDYFVAGNKVHVFNLGNEVPMYIRSLREFRAFDFVSGDIDGMSSLLDTNTFPEVVESEDAVVLHDSQMKITRASAKSTKSNAPDHLARLFAYNDIMRKVGATYFTQDYVNDDLVNEAVNAYVVSPVSSLIVLETAKDYERFDIKNVDESLLNAVRKHSGAVPEPHEWALIVLFGVFVLFVMFRQTRVVPLS